MRERQNGDSDQLTSSWPRFLDLLDSDPDQAFTQFYRFAVGSLTDTPPPLLLSFDESERLEMIHIIICHCVDNDFRNLRKYADKGKPFAGWLYITAYNKGREEWRKRHRSREMLSIHGDGQNPGIEESVADHAEDVGTRAEKTDLLSKVLGSLEEMDRKCRLLLKMAFDEFTIAEMVTALRLPKDQNAKVSDGLRYCRKKLYKLMADRGIEVAF